MVVDGNAKWQSRGQLNCVPGRIHFVHVDVDIPRPSEGPGLRQDFLARKSRVWVLYRTRLSVPP
jgi:hypothetical protein